MKSISVLLAGAALCASAHATVYQYDFSVAVQEMVEFSPSTLTGGAVNSSNLTGTTISVGDLIYGHFSYDTDTGLLGNFSAGPVYSSSGANNTLSASHNFHNLALDAASDNTNVVQVLNNAAILNGGDDFAVGNLSSNARASQLMVVSFFDPSGLALSNDGIPGAIVPGAFSQSNFSYLYTDKASNTMMGANGTLTSLTLATPVPEPESYAMLLGGLGLLGFLARRRKAAR